MKHLLAIITIFIIPFTLKGQVNLQGNIYNENTNEPIQFADIIVYDSIRNMTLSTRSDENGEFKFVLLPSFKSGNLSVQHLGFASYKQALPIRNSRDKLLIRLQPVSKELLEVIVNSRQNAITASGDKLIYNIEKLETGSGNNGLETMRTIPGVKLDKDDNILFRGVSSVQIMVNGKKSLLQGAALREFIRSLKGSDIQYVEVIAQPSAKYDAAGTAGIINIVLKKNKSTGFSGNLYTYTAYGEFFKSQNGGRLFYNDSLWTINANGSYYDGNSVNHRHVEQSIQLDEGIKTIDQYNEWLPATVSKNMNVGIERKLSRYHIVSTDWQYSKSDENDNTYGVTSELLNAILINEVDLMQTSVNATKRLTGNVFYNYTADSSATKFDAQLNYARYNESRTGTQQNSYNDNSSTQLDGHNATRYRILSAQADIKQRLSKNVTLEAGVKYSDVEMSYYNNYITDNAAQLIIPDSLLINDFVYKEYLSAVYTQLSLTVNNWNFLGGIRAEGYKYDAISLTNGEPNKKNYLNWFPSFSANYERNDNQYQFSYSRRIERPSYLALNPYYQYIDAYTVERGNPYLRPQMYHSIQLSYIYKNALSFSLYGYFYKKGFVNVIDYRESHNYNSTYQANASTGNRIGFSASLPYEPFKWWNMQLSLDASYSSEKSKITGFSYDGSGFGYDINLYENFVLNDGWSLNWNGFYTARATTPNGYSKATYDFSMTVKKYMLDKKLLVQGGCSNIIKNSFYNQVTRVDKVTTNWTNKWETRKFYLQLTWYFGGTNSKKVKTASLSEEINRT